MDKVLVVLGAQIGLIGRENVVSQLQVNGLDWVCDSHPHVAV